MQESPFEKDYGAVASEYERTRYGTLAGQFVSRCETRLLRRAIIAYAKRRQVLLDVACGTGHFTSKVADLFDRVVAVDFTPAMLARAAINVSRAEWRHVSLVQASAAALPLADGSCDVVLSTRFLHLFPREMHREILEALLRPLRQGGLLIVDHDTRFVEWRARHQHKRDGSFHSYDSDEAPASAQRVARLGVSGPRLPSVALKWPGAAEWLTRCFVHPPLNRVSTILILVYLKR